MFFGQFLYLLTFLFQLLTKASNPFNAALDFAGAFMPTEQRSLALSLPWRCQLSPILNAPSTERKVCAGWVRTVLLLKRVHVSDNSCVVSLV